MMATLHDLLADGPMAEWRPRVNDLPAPYCNVLAHYRGGVDMYLLAYVDENGKWYSGWTRTELADGTIEAWSPIPRLDWSWWDENSHIFEDGK